MSKVRILSLLGPGTALLLPFLAAAALHPALALPAAGAPEGAAPAPLAFRADESVVVVLKDGTEVAGVLVRETETEVAIRSTFGVTTIAREKIREIRRGENPHLREYQERLARAEKIGKADFFAALGEWASEKGLAAESRSAFSRAIALDPECLDARRGLGHARLDGAWVDADRVAALEKEGYVREGLDLVRRPAGSAPPEGGSNGSPPTGAAPPGVTPVPTPGAVPTPSRPLTPAEEKERARAEKERAKLIEKRRKDREKFEEKKRLEFLGVPWNDRHKIRSAHYDIECNSTLEVAQTYQWILESLYSEFSNRFLQKHIRQGRLPVLIYKTQQEFMDRTGMPPNVGGFYSPPSEQVNAFHGVFGDTATTFNVLAHELTHQFQGRVVPDMGQMGTWIIEGFAVYFGDGSRIDYKKKKVVTRVVPRDRLFHIQDKMREGTHEPLRKLASIPQMRFGGSQYADGWAILFYLLNGPEKEKGQEMVSRYWLLGCEQRVGQDEFNELANHYFGSVDELEAKYKEFILSLKPEPAGKVDDDGVFVSEDFMFELMRPDPSWSIIVEDVRPRELVAMVKEGIPDRIAVRMLSKPDDKQAPQDYVTDVVLAGLSKNSEGLTHEKTELDGHAAWKLEWSDPDPNAVKPEDPAAPPAGGAPPPPPPPAPPEPAPPEPTPVPPPPGGAPGEKKEEPKPRMKYRAYLVVGITNAYMIRGEFPLDATPDRLAAVDTVATTFRRIFRNRW